MPPPRRSSLARFTSNSNCFDCIFNRMRYAGSRNYHIKSKAFTLAEVLITLGIIGVVAALTLPSLIHKHKINVLESQFKKAYSVIENINLQMLNNDINPYADYNNANNRRTEEVVNKQVEDFVRFTNGARVCNNHYIACATDKRNGTTEFYNFRYKTLDNSNYAHIDADAYTKKTILMPDGMTIWLGGQVFGWDRYYVDINGTAKKPNRMGYDLFIFTFDNKNAIVPLKDSDKNNNNKCSFTSPAHRPEYLGTGCTYYAAANQNPDEEGKTYWKDFLK